MRIIHGLFLILSLALCSPGEKQARGWHGIVPLHSTRQDVERLLGPSTEGCHCTYSLGDDNVFIQYSGEPCADVRERGWNVPRDTVINISVYPKVKPRLSAFKIDLTKYKKIADKEIEGVFYLDNEGDGIGMEVDGDTVLGFYYTAAKRDERLRCRAAIGQHKTKCPPR